LVTVFQQHDTNNTDVNKMLNTRKVIVISFIACPLIWTTSTSAQLPLWDTFSDVFSTSVCDLINAENAELVLLRDSDQLMIVSGNDVIMQDTFVDANGFVFFEGLPFGLLDFTDDGDGLRTLWWMTLLGRAIHIDELSGLPSVSNVLPSEVFDVPCDASAFWDGCLADTDCDNDNVCTIDTCVGGVCFHSDVIGICNDGNACTTIDACIAGECVGTPIADCTDDTPNSNDPPLVTINLCGTSTTIPLVLTALGLGLMRLHRRRYF